MIMDDLKNKKITIWGLGREGNACLRRLRAFGIESEINIFTDTPLSIEAKEELSHLMPLSFFSKDDLTKILDKTDVVIKAPGVSLYRKEIIQAKKKGVIFTSSSAIFFAHCKKYNPDMKIIAVTGTKGKSTTVSIIAHLLRTLGYKTAVGGNIGVPLVDFLNRDAKFDFMVAEISSYQASDLGYSPDIGLLINLYPEHFDWHKSHENYYKDKLKLFENAKQNQPVVINYQDKLTEKYCKNIKNSFFYNNKEGIHIDGDFIADGVNRVFPISKIRIRGEHNYSNICAALTVIKLLDRDIKEAAEGLKDFNGLSHRLQILGEKKQITFVNDSISTAPETAVAAIKAFCEKHISLIAGGFDRNQDYKTLAKACVKNNVKLVLTMNQTGEKIAKAIRQEALEKDVFIEVIETSGLDEAFSKACHKTPQNGVVLLSPAAPSYGAYKDFQERGNHFLRLYNEI